MKNLNIAIISLLLFTSCNFSIFSHETELEYDTSFEITFEPLSDASKPFLTGKVVDSETGEALPFANVIVYLGQNLVAGAQTDFDGIFKITDIDIGNYSVKATYSGYRINQATTVNIEPGFMTQISFLQKSNPFVGLSCGGYRIPLIKQGETTTGQTFDSDFIKRMAF